MEFKQLTADRKRIVQVPVGVDEKNDVVFGTLTIWHRPLTPAMDQAMKEMADRMEAEEAAAKKADLTKPDDAAEAEPRKSKPILVAQLLHCLSRWDVTVDGTTVPPSEDRLMSLEWEVLAAIRDAIFDSIFPKATT